MWVTKLLISQVKKRIFCPKATKFGPKLAFWSIWARPCRLIRCPVGGSLGCCGARAVSRKTPIYFIKQQMLQLQQKLEPYIKLAPGVSYYRHTDLGGSPPRRHLFLLVALEATKVGFFFPRMTVLIRFNNFIHTQLICKTVFPYTDTESNLTAIHTFEHIYI